MPAMRVTAGKARDALFERIAPQLGVAPAIFDRRRQRHRRRGRSRGETRLRCSAPCRCRWTVSGSAACRPAARAVQFADVEVDIETGITKVKKIVCVQDCGLIVDLKTAETQCYGGIISGVNYAVFEERILDRNTANMVNPNMEWYFAGAVGHSGDRRGAGRSAGARRDRHRRAAGGGHRRGDRQRDQERDGRDAALPITPDKLLAELERAGGTN